jgi:hypothetical protein
MNYVFDKKSTKSLKSPQRYISLGIPANIAVGPLGFRAVLDVDPEGLQSRPYHDSEAGRSDSRVTLDEKNPRPSRIVLNDKKNEDRGPPAPETSTLGVVADGTGHGNDPASECF